jgi:ATP adenylyltransferase
MLNPFLDPHPALRIIDVTPAHYLVLNKFAVVPEHFILATTQYKEQTHLLEKQDLAAAYACVMAYKAQGKELFGFFNSGIHSGASQPHRHIQFLPVESMMSGIELADWKLLIDSLLTAEPAGTRSPISPSMSPPDKY